MARSIGVQDATTQLRSPASKERLKAARELLRLADPLSASALADAVATETDPKVGGVLVAALRAVGGAESVRGVALGLERFDVGVSRRRQAPSGWADIPTIRSRSDR